MNQCDGCRRGLPIDANGTHYNPDGSYDRMKCTAHKYGCKPDVLPRAVRAAAEIWVQILCEEPATFRECNPELAAIISRYMAEEGADYERALCALSRALDAAGVSHSWNGELGTAEARNVRAESADRNAAVWEANANEFRDMLHKERAENTRLNTDAEFSHMAVERAEKAEAELAEVRRTGHLPDECVIGRMVGHSEPDCPGCAQDELNARVDTLKEQNQLISEEVSRIGVTAETDINGWLLGLRNKRAESAERERDQYLKQLSMSTEVTKRERQECGAAWQARLDAVEAERDELKQQLEAAKDYNTSAVNAGEKLQQRVARLEETLVRRQGSVWQLIKALRDETAQVASNAECGLEEMRNLGMDAHLPTISEMCGYLTKSPEKQAAIAKACEARAIEAALSPTPEQEPGK